MYYIPNKHRSNLIKYCRFVIYIKLGMLNFYHKSGILKFVKCASPDFTWILIPRVLLGIYTCTSMHSQHPGIWPVFFQG